MIVPELVEYHRWRASLPKAERLRAPMLTETVNGLDSFYEGCRAEAREERATIAAARMPDLSDPDVRAAIRAKAKETTRASWVRAMRRITHG